MRSCRMKIKKLPNILALHLKRFKYQEDIQKYIKLTYRVAFPLELRLFNTVDDAPDPDRLYELFAIVIHIGACVIIDFLFGLKWQSTHGFSQRPSPRTLYYHNQGTALLASL